MLLILRPQEFWEAYNEKNIINCSCTSSTEWRSGLEQGFSNFFVLRPRLEKIFLRDPIMGTFKMSF